MFVKSLVSLLAFCDVLSLAAASGKSVPKRPDLKPSPYHPGRHFPSSPARSKSRYCYVKPGKGSDRDDAGVILKAFEKCNNGGTVVLDDTYLIASPLDLTFLEHIDVAITGTIKFKDDVEYWADNSFKYTFQDSSTFWKFGGKDINIFGDLSNGNSVIDGQGELYWEAYTTNTSLLRPALFVLDGGEDVTISNLRMKNSPFWFNLIANSSNVFISDLDLKASSLNGTTIKNTDGWDTYRTDNLILQNCVIDNQDDCVSFKPNSTNMVVQNLVCNGSHGISVGSLGQYKDEVDIVENVYVYNISMSNAENGARIKVWPGVETDFQDNLDGGGGSGYVRNITYDVFYQENNDQAITITQCYGQSNQTLCNEYPANLTISDVLMKNFWGTTSTDDEPEAGSLICSAADLCTNIRVQNINITVPSGAPPVYECVNLNDTLLEITCVDD